MIVRSSWQWRLSGLMCLISSYQAKMLWMMKMTKCPPGVVGVMLVNWIHEFLPDNNLQLELRTSVLSGCIIHHWLGSILPFHSNLSSSRDLDHCNQIITSYSKAKVSHPIQDQYGVMESIENWTYILDLRWQPSFDRYVSLLLRYDMIFPYMLHGDFW